MRKRLRRRIKIGLKEIKKNHITPGRTNEHSKAHREMEMGALERAVKLMERGTISEEDADAVALMTLVSMAAAGKQHLSRKQCEDIGLISTGIVADLIDEYGPDGLLLLGGATAATVLTMHMHGASMEKGQDYEPRSLRKGDWKRDFEVA